MTTAIKDLAEKLNQSLLTLDKEGLGSGSLADLMRRAFSGKVVSLRGAKATVSTDASLQFQAVADWFLGAQLQPVQGLGFTRAGQLECVLIATLPQRWDFSWAYPDLPDYIDNSNPSGEVKPSFFSDLHFGKGLTALFSSCDFRQDTSSETIEALKKLDPSVDWKTVRQGLNFRGEIDLAAIPFMAQLCQYAGVKTSLPVSGALNHNKFDDEIRLQVELGLDMRRFAKELPFDIGVSSLVLSSVTSQFDFLPKSSVRFLGHINFGKSPQNSYEVALFWPIGSKQLILSNVGPIPFPGVDKFLLSTDPSHEVLNGVSWDAFEIREIVLGVTWDPLSIASFWLSVGSPKGWKASFLRDDLKNLLSIEEYVLRLDLKPQIKVSAQAAFMIGGGRVHMWGIYPDLSFAGSLAPHQEIDLSGLLGLFLPSGNGNGNSALPTSSLKIRDLDVEADFKQHIYAFDLEVASAWEISIGGVKMLPLRSLRLSLEKDGDWTSVSLDSVCTIAGVDLYLSANYMGDSDVSEWTFYGKTAPERNIPFGALMKDLVVYIGGDGSKFPKALESFVVRNLRAEFQVGEQSEGGVKFHCEGEWTVATHEGQDLLVDLSLTVARKTEKGARITTFDGSLTIGDLDFTVTFIDEEKTDSATDLLVATYSHKSGQQKLRLGQLLESVVQDETGLTRALDSVEIDLKDAVFAYNRIDKKKNFLFGFDIGARLSLEDLPLVGKEFSADSNVSIDNLQAVVAWKPFTVGEVQRLNALLPKNVNKLPAVLKTSNGAGAEDSEDEDADPAAAIALQEGFNIGATLNLGNISRPLSLPASGPPKAAPEASAATSPATEPTQPTKPEPGEAPASSPTADNATWFKIQKSLGPIHLEQVGMQYRDAAVWFLLDAALGAAGLTLSLNGFSVGLPINEFKPGLPINEFKPRFELRGLSVDYRNEALEIGGAFLKTNEKEYAGAAVLKVKQLTISALGMYREMDDGKPSMFIYAVLDYPIGGPSFFFVTGLAAGFGYNRALKMPAIDRVANFSLVENARGGAGMPKDIAAELQKMKGDITPAAGQHFLAIGLKFTSFKVVDSFALLTVSFGNQFEMNLLGLSTLVAPANAGKGTPPVAEAQLALKASFQPDKGFLGVQAQLTPNSYLLSKDCHLTGGFAFFSWFAGSKHDGDFVLTLGGYHPHFRVPAHYPRVPRLGFNWQVTPELSLKGDAYFALTASALMAGGRLEADWRSGSVHAWFKLGADFLIAWKPYHYHIDAYVDMGAEVTFEFFGAQHITIDVGADLHIWGPEFTGEATIHLWIISFNISFGLGARQKPSKIGWDEFRSSFLPENRKTTGQAVKKYDVLSLAVTGGLIGKEPEGKADYLGIVDPKRFSLAINTLIPVNDAKYVYKSPDGKDDKKPIETGPRSFTKCGIAPLDVKAKALNSTQTITILCNGAAVGENTFKYRPILKKVPVALWGESMSPELNGNQFVENALCGFEIQVAAEPAAGGSVETEQAKLQAEHSGKQLSCKWESAEPFVAKEFKTEKDRKDELQKAFEDGATGRQTMLASLGFTEEEIKKIGLSKTHTKDFLIAPQIEKV